MVRNAGQPPKTRLQAARFERGWEQSHVLSQLRCEADAHGDSLAKPASLKTMLSRWENGQELPGDKYQRLLSSIYGRDAAALGFDEPATPTRIVVPRMAPAASVGTVDYFRNVLQEHIRADNLMGPHHLVGVVCAQASLLEQILPATRGDIHDDLVLLAYAYNEFAGWLYQDAGEPNEAMRHSDLAMDYALGLNDPQLTAYVLMRKSNIACDMEKPERTLSLVAAAWRHASRISPASRAMVLIQQARAHAAVRDESACRRAIDGAIREVMRPGAEEDPQLSYCTPGYVAMETASCWTALGKPDTAIPLYERGLADWPLPFQRDQGLCLARYATAHAARGDVDNAIADGYRAVEVITAATSVRAIAELRRLHKRLTIWRTNDDVRQLRYAIASLAL